MDVRWTGVEAPSRARLPLPIPRRMLRSRHAPTLLATLALLLVPGSASAAGDGCTGTASLRVGMDRPLLADGCAVAVLTIAPNPVAPGAPVSFSAAGSLDSEGSTDEIAIYAWDFGDGAATETSGQTTEHTYPDRGIYTVQLTTLDADDVQIQIAFQELVVDVPPVAALAGPTGVVRPGDLVEFDATGSTAMAGGSVDAYLWDWGDGSPIEETTSPIATHRFLTEAASSSVTVRAVDDLGVASAPVSHAIVVHNDLPTVTLSASPSTVAVGQSLTLNATATDGDGTIVLYRWDLNGDGVYETPTETVASASAGGFANAGQIVLGVKVFDDSGGSRVKQIVVTVVAPAGGDGSGGGATGSTGGDDGGDDDGSGSGDATSGGTTSGGSGSSSGGARFTASLSGAAIQRLNGVLRRGIGVRAAANRIATGTLAIALSGRDARRLGLRSRRIGHLRIALRPGSAAKASVKLTRPAARALRRSRPATLRVTIRGTLTAGTERTKVARLVLLRG